MVGAFPPHNKKSYMLYVAKIELSKQHSVNKEITSELNNSKTVIKNMKRENRSIK